MPENEKYTGAAETDLSPEDRAKAIADAFKGAGSEGITNPDALPPKPLSRRERVIRYDNSVKMSKVEQARTVPTPTETAEASLPPFGPEIVGKTMDAVEFLNRYFENLDPTYITSQPTPEGIVSTALKAYRGYVRACRVAKSLGDNVYPWQD